MSKRTLVGGLVAVGLLTASAGTASAQFVTPFGQPGPYGGNYGAVYPTPNGGIVQQQAYTDPFSGSTYLNRTYANPYTGSYSNRQAYIPYVSPFYPAAYRPPAIFSGYGYGGYNYGRPYNYGYTYGRYFR